MKVKKLLKVISPTTKIIFWDNYGEMDRIYIIPINIPETYLERKVEEIWIDANRSLNIVIDGTIDSEEVRIRNENDN